MSGVARIMAPEAHSLLGMMEHLNHDKPQAGLLLTRTMEGWEWRFYGDIPVTELVGGLELVKHDFLATDREQV